MSTPPQQPAAEPIDVGSLANFLGPQLAAFKPNRANFAAGIVLGLLTAGGGLALVAVLIAYATRRDWQLPWFATGNRDELSWFLVGLGVVAGGGLLAVGIEFFATSR